MNPSLCLSPDSGTQVYSYECLDGPPRRPTLWRRFLALLTWGCLLAATSAAAQTGSVRIIGADNKTIANMGNGTAATALRVTLASDSTGQVTLAAGATVALAAGAATVGSFKITDGTTTVSVIAGTAALKTDLSSIAGTATVTAGVNGLLAVGGSGAANAALSGNPVPVAGSDYGGTAKTQYIKVDASGFVHVTNEASTGTTQVATAGLTLGLPFQTTVTTSAAALATNTSKNVCIRADGGNTDFICWGSTSGVTCANGKKLYAGEETCRTLANTNQIFVIANTGSQTLLTDFEN